MIDLVLTVVMVIAIGGTTIKSYREIRSVRNYHLRQMQLSKLAAVDAFLGIALRTCRLDDQGRVGVVVQRSFRQ